MLGQIPPCGTGDTEIMIDEEKLMNINDSNIDEDEIYNNLCDEDALSFNFDLPMTNQDNITTKNILITTK
jgi:hypothetical protein